VLDLRFAVEGATAVEFAATPTVLFTLRIDAPATYAVRSVSLSAQVRIMANQRPYAPNEQRRLADVFGDVQHWSTTLGSVLWTHVTSVVPPFSGSTTVDLPVACTYDFEVSAARYFHAVRDGIIPLEFLFSGSVFYATEAGLQATRINWNAEARFGMPASVWAQAVEFVFPNSAWLRIGRETFERLADFRGRNALPSWEAALDALLAASQSHAEPVSP
jgi:hypothetical protein